MTYDAICISDLHLGSLNCEAKRLRRFLHKLKKGRKLRSRLLIIVGDGFDNLNPKKLKKRHRKVIRLIHSISKRMDVVWLQGNHDADALYIEKMVGVKSKEEHVFISGEKSIYLSHGHQHDIFIQKHPVATMIADIVYSMTQFIDPSHTLARHLKKKSKKFIKVITRVKVGAAEAAARHGCKIAIHGHNHQAGCISINGVDVWDAGCWTELPCSYLTILDGQVKLHMAGD